jgi:hypothetical protein
MGGSIREEDEGVGNTGIGDKKIWHVRVRVSNLGCCVQWRQNVLKFISMGRSANSGDKTSMKKWEMLTVSVQKCWYETPKGGLVVDIQAGVEESAREHEQWNQETGAGR